MSHRWLFFVHSASGRRERQPRDPCHYRRHRSDEGGNRRRLYLPDRLHRDRQKALPATMCRSFRRSLCGFGSRSIRTPCPMLIESVAPPVEATAEATMIYDVTRTSGLMETSDT